MLGVVVKLLVGVAVWAGPSAQGTLPAKGTLPAELQAEVERLEGHEVQVAGGSYKIVDIAGEGVPSIGCVRKTPRGLELESNGDTLLLRGPLAVPRIAGPNYRVWVLGAVTARGELHATRLGILAGPEACPFDDVAAAAR